MRAFHGKQEIKDFYLARVRAHAAADEIIHGVYWEKGKGCAVGCTVHAPDHLAYETELGIPNTLAGVEDSIFEALKIERAKLWPEQFLMAPNVGADLSLVWPKFAIWLLTDPVYGMLQFSRSVTAEKVIRDVADACQLVVEGAAKDVDWHELRRNAAPFANAYDAPCIAFNCAASFHVTFRDATFCAAPFANIAASHAVIVYIRNSHAACPDANVARSKFCNAQADKLLALMWDA